VTRPKRLTDAEDSAARRKAEAAAQDDDNWTAEQDKEYRRELNVHAARVSR
jgi:hypothetical protein